MACKKTRAMAHAGYPMGNIKLLLSHDTWQVRTHVRTIFVKLHFWITYLSSDEACMTCHACQLQKQYGGNNYGNNNTYE